MTIYFCATGYNLNNRAFNFNSLDKVVNSSLITDYNTEDKSYIYPEPLPIPQSLGEQLINNNCDYAVFIYNNKKHYCFVNNILYNAVTNGYMLYFQEDIWATYGLKETYSATDKQYNFKAIRGNLVRGHVNDWENGKATLQYCSDNPEAEILTDGIVFKRSLISSTNYKILYVLVNAGNTDNVKTNPLQSIFNAFYDENNNLIERTRFNQYNLYYIPINVSTGKSLNIRKGTQTYQISGHDIREINVVAGVDTGVASVGVVNMVVSDILPQGSFFSGDTLYIPDTVVDISTNEMLYSDTMPLVYDRNLKCYDRVSIPRGYLYGNDYPLPIIESYESYLNYGIVKVNTDKYNPRALYYDGCSFVLNIFQQIKSCIINLDPTLQYISISENTTVKRLYSQSTIFKINCNFEPLAHNSYWTRLITRQSTIEADRNLVVGKLNYSKQVIQGVIGVAKSGLNVASAGFEQAAAFAKADPVKMITSSFNTAQAGLSFASDVVGFGLDTATGALNLQTLKERTEIIKQQNETIINNGIVQQGSFATSGFYLFNSDLYLIEADLTAYNKLNIAKELHTYGYETSIVLDETYFTKHERRFFNFILAENTMVTGLPLRYCRDIEDMFNKGVTLWKGTPAEYEVINLPVNAESEV